jgi:hypothetical protein
MINNLEKLKYPIGKFKSLEQYTLTDVKYFINTIKLFPSLLMEETSKLTANDLEKNLSSRGLVN